MGTSVKAGPLADTFSYQPGVDNPFWGCDFTALAASLELLQKQQKQGLLGSLGAPDPATIPLPTFPGNSIKAAKEIGTRKRALWPERRVPSDFTTVMVQNLAVWMRKSAFAKKLDRLGFQGKYDFVHIPVSDGGKKRGLAIVNFVDTDTAQVFCGMFNKQRNWRAMPADVQGYEANHRLLKGKAKQYEEELATSKSKSDGSGGQHFAPEGLLHSTMGGPK